VYTGDQVITTPYCVGNVDTSVMPTHHELKEIKTEWFDFDVLVRLGKYAITYNKESNWSNLIYKTSNKTVNLRMQVYMVNPQRGETSMKVDLLFFR